MRCFSWRLMRAEAARLSSARTTSSRETSNVPIRSTFFVVFFFQTLCARLSGLKMEIPTHLSLHPGPAPARAAGVPQWPPRLSGMPPCPGWPWGPPRGGRPPKLFRFPKRLSPGPLLPPRPPAEGSGLKRFGGFGWWPLERASALYSSTSFRASGSASST